MHIELGKSASKTVSLSSPAAKWWIGGIVAVSALLVAVVVIWIHKSEVESTPCKDALAKILANPKAVALLGTPVAPGYLGTETNSEDETGSREQLTISVHGPRGEGDLEVDGREKDGRWSYAVMRLTVGEEELDLLADASGH